MVTVVGLYLTILLVIFACVCYDALTEHTRLLILIVAIMECNTLLEFCKSINALYNNMCTIT